MRMNVLARVLALATLVPIAGAQQDAQQILRPARPEASGFGTSVGVSRRVLLVGVPSVSPAGGSIGFALSLDPVTGQRLEGIAGDGPRFAEAAAVQGDLLVLGAPSPSGGEVRAHLLTDGSLLATLTSVNPTGEFGAALAVDGTTTAVGAPGDDTVGPNAGAVFVGDPSVGPQLLRLLPPGPTEGFGSSVALAGGRVVAGAPGDDGLFTDAGRAYLFDTSTPQQPLELVRGDPFLFDEFGHAVAMTASHVAVAAPVASGAGGLFAGAVYVFDAATGSELYKLGGPQNNARFGDLLAIEGNTLVVVQEGAVASRVFLYDITTGASLGELLPDGQSFSDQVLAVAVNEGLVGITTGGLDGLQTSRTAWLIDLATGDVLLEAPADGGQAFDFFGDSLDVDGTTVVTGSPLPREPEEAVMALDLTTGQALYELTPPIPGDYSWGHAIALDGAHLAVGYPRVGPTQVDGQGSVFLYEDGLPVHQLGHSDGVFGDRFGEAVDLDASSGLVLVGAPEVAFDAGAVYVFDLDTGDELHRIDPPPGGATRFGRAVAIDGTRGLVGAFPGNGSGPGTAWLLDLVSGTVVTELVVPGLPNGGQFGRSVALDGPWALVGAPHLPAGGAWLFDAVTGALQRELVPVAPESGDGFGTDVVIDGDLLVISAPGDDDRGEDSGSVHLFDAVTGEPLGILGARAVGAGAGLETVAADDGRVLASTADDNPSGESSGAIYVHDVSGPWMPFSHGLAGKRGVPALAVEGDLAPSSPVSFSLVGASPEASAGFVLGLSSAFAPFKQGVLVPSPDLVVFLVTDSFGALSFPLPFPAGVPGGTELWVQQWIQDAGAPAGWAASNAVRGVVP